MNSRNRREVLDPLEVTLRDSLRAAAGSAAPAPTLRRRLLQRAARQQRRLPWRAAFGRPGLFRESHTSHDHLAAQYHLLYVENLFGPRLGWFSFNQLMR
ncbi:MAG: hypothetical protein IT317_02175 [Anaerolineales bacterium]|nr:hypothetical protein [Anaerolineales bacterium]